MFNSNKETPKKSNISELAHISTLSEEELLEADREATGDANSDGVVDAHDYMPKGSEAFEKEPRKLNHTEPVFTVQPKPDVKSMYDFMLYHSYWNVMGVLSLAIGAVAMVMLIMSIADHAEPLQIGMFAVVVAIFLGNSPLTLWFRAKKQAKIICEPENLITYSFSEAGFDMTRGEEYADFSWNNAYKVKEGRNGFYIYLEKNRAFVVTKADMSFDIGAFRSLLKSNVAKRCYLDEQ